MKIYFKGAPEGADKVYAEIKSQLARSPWIIRRIFSVELRHNSPEEHYILVETTPKILLERNENGAIQWECACLDIINEFGLTYLRTEKEVEKKEELKGESK